MAVGYDVTYGNVSLEDATRMGSAALHGLTYEHIAGSTEPWVSRLVADLVIAIGAQRVLETGGYLGDTSTLLATTLEAIGGGVLDVCEIDQVRAHGIRKRLNALDIPRVLDGVHRQHAFETIRQAQNGYYDLAFVDDHHIEAHVRAELELLYPKMRPGGIIAMHDVCGVCPGNQYPLGRICNEFGGYVLNLPRLGPAGGLGIIQVPI